MANKVVPAGYKAFLRQLKDRIRKSQISAVLSVNRELVLLYWRMGREILRRQVEATWGDRVIERLAEDLRLEFPEMTGLSARNLKYMRAFADAWQDEPFVQQLVAQIPWGHNVRLLDMVGDRQERLWYVAQTVEHNWSRAVLVHQIQSGLYRRQGKALNNFKQTLPAPQGDLAQQLLKDPYNFEFLSLGTKVQERDLENALISHVCELILELGKGFALMGRQYHLEVGGDDFYVDLLFYHIRLRCFVVIELKTDKFKPEFAGKMNFYLSAVDDLMREQGDGPSIGIILCQGRNRLVVEYALRDTSKPMGVAQYELKRSLPASLRGELPTTSDLERLKPAPANRLIAATKRKPRKKE